jgi:hypothetical protein
MPKVFMIAGLLAVFTVVAFGMVMMLPQPLKNSDYLVAGSVATLVTLGAAFLGYVRKNPQSEVFFKKRPKR